MVFITGANKKFKEAVTYNIRNMAELGYEFIVYDLGNLGIGYPIEGLNIKDPFGFNEEWELSEKARTNNHPCLFKYDIIRHALKYHVADDEILVFLDADTYVYRRIDEIEVFFIQKACDVGLTMRPEGEFDWYGNPETEQEWTGYINTGVIMIKKTEPGLKFVDRWIATQASLVNDPSHTPSEQWALNRFLNNKIVWGDRGRVVEIEGIRICFLDCGIYNNYDGARLSELKIKHNKGSCLPPTWDWPLERERQRREALKKS